MLDPLKVFLAFLEAFDYLIPIYLKDDLVKNKEIQGNSKVSNVVNGN